MRILATLMLLGACSGTASAPTTTGTVTTTTQGTTTTTVDCAKFVEDLRRSLSDTVSVLVVVEAAASDPIVVFRPGDVADTLTIAAADIREITSDVGDLGEPPAELADIVRYLSEALDKLESGIDGMASGLRQGSQSVIDEATADLDAGIALTVRARQALPEGGC